jgi:predicted nuclease of predicted toxin-antitoxin system
MRFLVDECTGPAVAQWLRSRGYDTFSVYEQARGTDDDEVIRTAYAQDRILITNDKDFGEKVLASSGRIGESFSFALKMSVRW